jgi:hypothetical protein
MDIPSEIQELIDRAAARPEYQPLEDIGLRQGDIRVCHAFPEVEWSPPEMDDQFNGVGEGWVRARNGFGSVIESHPDRVEERWVLVASMHGHMTGYVSVLLCGTPLESEGWLTDHDLMLSPKETGGQWPHPIYCDLRAPVFTHQLGELVGRLDDLDAVRAASVGDSLFGPNQDRQGTPLRSMQDPRRAWKLGQLHVLHRLASGCTRWMLDESAESSSRKEPNY